MVHMRRLGRFCLVWACLAVAARGQDGLYADFTTSRGSFTVQLDYERAPRAVASFVGLATGAAGWADPAGNVWRKPFYDGTLFHRVVKDAATNGIAIQGGGAAECGLTYAELPGGPATSDGVSFSVVTTNPPGVTTNDFLHGLVPFVTVNAAAVPTNYAYGNASFGTVATALTRTVIQLRASSSNATQYVVNTHAATTWYTNREPFEVATTNWGTIHTVTTNAGPGSEVLLHRVQLSMAYTSTILGPVAGTNFVHAGYYMRDAATNGLLHTTGVIAMANSGPNTDGSQFFLTTTNVPYWDGSYTVFGRVTAGLDVVAAIAAVAVQGPGSRPVADVTLSNVVIRRVGAAAEGFDIAAHGVPVVESAGLRVVATGAQARVTVEIPPYAECLFRTSTNGLRDWRAEDWGYASNAATHLRQVETGAVEMAMYHVTSVRYPEAWTAPSSHVGRVFAFHWDTEPVTRYGVAFTNGAPAWEMTRGTNFLSGGILLQDSYAPRWTAYPYSATFYFADDRVGQFLYSLRFDPGAASNRFTATMWPWSGGGYAVTGWFTWE